MVHASRIALFEREIRETLSQAALDALFARVEVLSEGEACNTPGRSVYLGSTMLTCEVAGLGEVIREPADAGTTRRLALLLTQEQSLGPRIEAIARREVERIARATPKSVRGETKIRYQGTRIFMDIDVEATL